MKFRHTALLPSKKPILKRSEILQRLLLPQSYIKLLSQIQDCNISLVLGPTYSTLCISQLCMFIKLLPQLIYCSSTLVNMGLGEEHAVRGKRPIFNAIQRIYKNKTKDCHCHYFIYTGEKVKVKGRKEERKETSLENPVPYPSGLFKNCSKNKLARQKQQKSVGHTKITVSLCSTVERPLLCQGLLEGITQKR